MTTFRSAEEIGRTATGPRPLPPLGEQRVDADLPSVDTVLPNGLRLVAVRHPAVPMVELRMRIPFGGTEKTHAPRAELLATSLLSGTVKRNRVQMDTDLAIVGGELDSAVDPEFLHIGGSALASGVDTLLDVLGDALVHAAYDTSEVERERDRLVEQITLARSQPRVIAREALQRHRFGDHPFTREVPTGEDVAAVSVDEVRALHRAAVVPKGAVLVLTGDIDPDRIADQVTAAFTDWSSDTTAAALEPVPEVHGGDLRLLNRPGAVQSQIRLTAQAVTRTDPRYPALQLANLVFGGYFSSRLVENIREDKGYTYSAYSTLEFTLDSATLLIDADTASEATVPAVLETRYELGRLALVRPSDDEVDSARRYAIGSLLTGTASQASLASQLVALVSVGLDWAWLRAHPARLSAVTTDDVAAAALEFFAPSKFTGVIVGDADRLAEEFTALGGVTLP